VGGVQLVFSTTKTKLAQATPDNVKILMTNNLRLTPREIVELYGLRWQIELFFKEFKTEQLRRRALDEETKRCWQHQRS
jgi:IS4 transposase